VPAEWFERYGPPFSEWRLPKSKAKRKALVETIGQDGFDLWEMICQSPQVELSRMVSAVETLRQVWLLQHYVGEGKPRWRKPKDLPRSRQKIISPYDTEARFRVRRSTKWEGYRVHLTETCDEDQPLLITNVETTTSASLDLEWTDTVREHLHAKDLFPKHLVDGGYVGARAMAEGESIYGLDLIGLTKPDGSWQARRGGRYGLSSFVIDWQKKTGHLSSGTDQLRLVSSPEPTWGTAHRSPVGHGGLPCLSHSCPMRSQSQAAPCYQVPPQGAILALQKARQRQTTDEFQKTYAQRAAGEGTISQGTQVYGLRRCRYRGMAKTHLQHVFVAVAINLMRLAAWFEGMPRAKTRPSRFAAVAVAA
jgi:transposase